MPELVIIVTPRLRWRYQTAPFAETDRCRFAYRLGGRIGGVGLDVVGEQSMIGVNSGWTRRTEANTNGSGTPLAKLVARVTAMNCRIAHSSSENQRQRINAAPRPDGPSSSP
jgi:hypothetical protein